MEDVITGKILTFYIILLICSNLNLQDFMIISISKFYCNESFLAYYSSNYIRHLKILHCREFYWWDSFNFCSWVLLYYTWQDIKMWSQLNIVDNILLSKCWRIKAVFHSVNFCLWRFFCWSLQKSFCDNIKITLGTTFKLKCHINSFEITLPPNRCLLENFLFIFGGCSWYSFVLMMIFTFFIVINLFQ